MSRFVRFDLSVELTTELLRRHQTGHLADSDYRHQVLIGRFTKEALTVINIPDRALLRQSAFLSKSWRSMACLPKRLPRYEN